MLFSIAMALMVLLIAGFWTYQGFFSSVLMFFECALSSLLAFGLYESLSSVWESALGPGIGRPLAFLVLFIVPLVLMRLATDRLFHENVNLPLVVDRAGAGLFGLLAGLILVGTPLVGIQMLPMGPSLFGFERVTRGADGALQQKNLLLKPDAFALGLANLASGGSMTGGNPLSRAKPDMLLDLWAARACVQPEDRHVVPADSLKVNAYWEARQIDHVKQRIEGTSMARDFETRESPAGKKFLVFNVTLDISAGNADKPEIYLRVPQFRVAGPPPADTGFSRSPSIHPAVGMSDLYTNKAHNWHALAEGQAARLVRFNPDTDFFITSTSAPPVAVSAGKDKIKGFRFDVAFEVPEAFEPWYVAFKTGARCEINKKMFKSTPPNSASAALGNAGPGRSLGEADKPKIGKSPGGASQVANATDADVTDKIPIALSRDDSSVSRVLHGGKLGECHFFVEVPEEKVPQAEQVTQFDVPEGKKIVLLDADRNQALSMYGRAMNYAANVAAQITLKTADGAPYFAQGMYAMANVGGKSYFEIQYHPEAEVPERCLIKTKKVTESALKGTPAKERRYGYIFIVDPGIKLVSFSSGGPGKEQPVNINVPN